MFNKYIIKNATIVNKGMKTQNHILIENGIIKSILPLAHNTDVYTDYELIDATGLHVLPGIIDDHVHFREPGLTHKADIASETKAAIAGGVTSIMEMPNTLPPTTTIEAWEDKSILASQKSHTNYSFYLAATNDNINEIKHANPKQVCGVKLFLGSSTGNMLVDSIKSLEQLFHESPVLIGAHAEDEQIVQSNLKTFTAKYGDKIPFSAHPLIRNTEACVKATSTAIELATKIGSNLQIFHVSTAQELKLFNDVPLTISKKITAEVCIPHLWFSDADYEQYQGLIKVNPAIKTIQDRDALRNAMITNKIDLIATDHAPHLLDEKNNTYLKSPSGMPMIQHSLNIMLEFYHQGQIMLEQIVQKMCHAPAIRFRISKRGYVREGFFADLVLVDLKKPMQVTDKNILYKCGWSTLNNYTFKSSITHTFVNGVLVYNNGVIHEEPKGVQLEFNR